MGLNGVTRGYMELQGGLKGSQLVTKGSRGYNG